MTEPFGRKLDLIVEVEKWKNNSKKQPRFGNYFFQLESRKDRVVFKETFRSFINSC